MSLRGRKPGERRARAYPAAMSRTLSPFERAVAHTLEIEGGYVDDPNDRGGKTNWGITEAVARADGYGGAMHELTKARALDIYRRRYWGVNVLDQVAISGDAIALELFDTGVNMGVATAAQFLQRSLNALNRRGRDFADVTVDGRIGPATLAALAAYRARRGEEGVRILVRYLDALQGARYIAIAEARPANEEFVFGWGKRLGPIAA